MNKKITYKTDMIDRVSFICSLHQEAVNSLPKLKTALQKLTFYRGELADMMAELATSNKGYAMAKNQTWERLAQSLRAICSGMGALAVEREDPLLAGQARFNASRFQRMRCTDAISHANALLNIATEHAPVLLEFGIGEDRLQQARQLTEELRELHPQPVVRITSDKARRKALFEKLHQTNDFLRHYMDNLVRALRHTEPEFCKDYFEARKMRQTAQPHAEPETLELLSAEKLAEAAKEVVEEEIDLELGVERLELREIGKVKGS